MTSDEFWNLIERAGRGHDEEEQAEAIAAALAKLPPEEVVGFQRNLHDLLAASYDWKLWGAAYLINGGCSDDGFDYFRGWLIAKGRAIFERALADPDSLADLPDLEEDVGESMLSVAYTAYESATGGELPPVPLRLPDLGEGWDFDDDEEMQTRFPKLYEKFCG